MGYNTALMLLNDRLDSLENNPNAGKLIGEAVSRAYMERRAINISQIGVTVMPSHHADETQVLKVKGNLIESISVMHLRDDDKAALLKGLAEQLGYSLRKKKA